MYHIYRVIVPLQIGVVFNTLGTGYYTGDVIVPLQIGVVFNENIHERF